MTQDTPTVEEIVEEFEQNLVCYSPKIVSGAGGFYCGHKNGVELYDIDAMLNWLRTTLTTRQQAYEEGVKAERERCKNLVVAHLRTNTYDGNDALVFKTTIEEVVGLLSDKQPPMPCKECKQPIEPRKHPCGKVTKNDTYCSNECRLIARKRYSTWSWKRIVE